MTGTTRYILRQTLGPFLFVTLALTAVVWLTQSLRFVEMIVNRGLSAGSFVYLTLLLLPTFLSVILPIALFVSLLYAYHRLDVDSEIVVMRAAGLSPWTLARPALLLGGATTLLAYAIALYLMPAGFRAFKELQFDIRGDFASVMIQEGAFNTVGEGLTVYVRSREPNGELLGILVHDTRQAKRPITMMAEKGLVVRTSEGPRFILAEGNRQQVDSDGGQLSLLYFDRYSLDLSAYADQTVSRWREPGERYLHELFSPTGGHDDVKNAGRLRAEAHKRLTSPLYVMVFALLAVAAVLAGDFNRRNRWTRLVWAVAAGVLVQTIAIGLPTLAGTRGAMLPLLYVAVLALIGLGVWLIDRARAGRTGLVGRLLGGTI
ncbi:MAG: LPS export ABC transporter permease LptF [Alphaproteobacteria bacterium]|nr:LPS export ABC transporter permease LptF [Alphaproteobacteria bacterium]